MHDMLKEFKFLISNQKPVVFDHLPKCGGTSINRYLTTSFPKRRTFALNGINPNKSVQFFLNLTTKKRYRTKLVYGHLANRLFDVTHPESIRATVLREPIDRIISHYYYVKRNKDHYLYKKVVEENIQLSEYCYNDLSNELQNWYVTHFTGLSISEVEKNPKKSVESAFKNIIDKYHVIGFQDDIPLFIDNLKQAANINTQFKNEILNVTKKRIGTSQLDKSVLEKISKKNSLDIELFNRLYNFKKKEITKNKRH